jgi:hypothetical protein
MDGKAGQKNGFGKLPSRQSTNLAEARTIQLA